MRSSFCRKSRRNFETSHQWAPTSVTLTFNVSSPSRGSSSDTDESASDMTCGGGYVPQHFHVNSVNLSNWTCAFCKTTRCQALPKICSHQSARIATFLLSTRRLKKVTMKSGEIADRPKCQLDERCVRSRRLKGLLGWKKEKLLCRPSERITKGMEIQVRCAHGSPCSLALFINLWEHRQGFREINDMKRSLDAGTQWFKVHGQVVLVTWKATPPFVLESGGKAKTKDGVQGAGWCGGTCFPE